MRCEGDAERREEVAHQQLFVSGVQVVFFFWTERHCRLLSSVIGAPVQPKGNSGKLAGGGKI